MARQMEETLIGYRFGVRVVQVPQSDERGNAIYNGSGEPKTETNWILDLEEVTPHQRHIVHVPLNQAGRDALIASLTGGIAVAKAMPEGPIAL